MSYQYAVIADNETVAAFRSFPEPVDTSTIEVMASGNLRMRPVQENYLPITRGFNAIVITTVFPDKVVRDMTLEPSEPSPFSPPWD